MAGAGITLWGGGTSRAMRALWALHELGLDYDHKPIGARTAETLTDDYGHLNAKRKIPTLIDGEFVLTESGAIVNYLFSSYGAGADVFVPANPSEQAASDEWCYFALMELDGQCLYVIRRHEGLSGIYGEAPQAVASAREYCLKQINAVVPRIAAADPYLFGDRIGAADIILATTLTMATTFGVTLPAECLTYRARAFDRPAYVAATAANTVASGPSRPDNDLNARRRRSTP
jgi:glutathione S-transferase